MTLIPVQASPPTSTTVGHIPVASLAAAPTPTVSPPDAKHAIRTSLQASTVDGVFAAIFSNITGGVLLSNLLVELHATPMEIGFLASMPMVANLLQPLGALWGDRTTSRHTYCLWIYGVSRLLWVVLAIAILLGHLGYFSTAHLVGLTLIIVLSSHVLGALGSSSWLSWLACLVPARLRGHYFGIRNSSASLTSLICVPLAGFAVSQWQGGVIEGYGVVLVVGLICGFISLGFQYWMVDINPQAPQVNGVSPHPIVGSLRCLRPAGLIPPMSEMGQEERSPQRPPYFRHTSFWLFLLYFSLWMFAVNLSAPFFNLYLLDTLKLDVSQVTLYTSLFSAANLLMLVLWGKLADRIGNRTILVTIGILVALTPLLWLGIDASALSIWLWLPLLHLGMGGTWAAIDLCTNNLQLGVAPIQAQSVYFAIAAAVAGVCGALGTTVGGYLAEWSGLGLLGLFALSSVLRLVALLPLAIVQEQHRKPAYL